MGNLLSKKIYNKYHDSLIYEILCILTGERYYGSTTNLKARIKKHLSNNNMCISK